MDNSDRNAESFSDSSLKLIRNLVHDLKNPLTVALGNLQLLQMRTDSLEDKSKDLITNGIKAIYQQFGMLDNIADSARIAGNNYTPNLKSINIDSIINLEITEHQKLEPSKDYQFTTADTDTDVTADKKLLDRALHNIFEHVRLNTQNGSIIIVKSFNDIHNGVRVTEIDDNGELLLTKNYEYIFNMLSDINLETKNGRWDSGVYLSFSKIFLRLMNGNIVADDSGDTGAKFIITLPLATPQ